MSKPWIDIAEFNTVTDWVRVKQNVAGVIIRMGFRGSRDGKIKYDHKYKEHRRACEEHGIPHGFYFFPTAINDAEAVEEAEWVASQISNPKTLQMPLFADSEMVLAGSGRADKLPKNERTRFLRIFCERLQAKGIPAGVYASTNWLNTQLDMSRLPFSVWVAQYNTHCDYKGDYLLWQYTSKGSVPGISGNVDMSVLKNEIPVENESIREKVLSIAASFIGTKEHPAGSNNVIFNTDYYGREVQGANYPWCCAFVWDVFRLAGASSLFYGGKKTAYCPTALNWYGSQGRIVNIPQRGDIAFFDFYGTGVAGHIGFVENVSGNTIKTIEGNTSVSSDDNGGAVMRRNRGIGSVLAFARPNYDKKAVAPRVDTSAFPLIKYGSQRRDWVLLLQNALTVRGFPTTIDGVFGYSTLEQVVHFQYANHLTVDGEVGEQTWHTLFN